MDEEVWAACSQVMDQNFDGLKVVVVVLGMLEKMQPEPGVTWQGGCAMIGSVKLEV